MDCAHPDLKPSCVAGIAYNHGIASYGLTAARDDYGHGTYIAGVVASAGDGKGLAGLMYGGAALYVCRFIDAQGYGTTADALLCLNWCMQKGATVSSEPALLLLRHRCCCCRAVRACCACSARLPRQADNLWGFPSASPGSAGSNFGSNFVDIAAPGVLVWTTCKRSREQMKLLPPQGE